MAKRIAFVTYETPYAPCGGIAAVMDRLPIAYQEETKLPVSVITPFHYNIKKTLEVEKDMNPVGEIILTYGGQNLRFSILRIFDRVEWIFLKCLDLPLEEPPLFSGLHHPYDLSQDRARNSQILLRDALLFGGGAAKSLRLLYPKESITLFLQDWEAATTALAAATTPQKLSVYLILHNSYDSFASDEMLVRSGIDPTLIPGSTILTRSLPLVNKPVFTVSNQFAIDLVEEEILQSKVMAPHLSAALKSILVGVNNGLFTDLSIPEEVLSCAEQGDFDPFSAWKMERRQSALKVLDGLSHTHDGPIWGNPGRFTREDLPWFILAGRDDSRQKGYDIAYKAIDEALREGLPACFIFFPIPGDEGLAGLNFLQKLAEKHPDRVLVLPFIFREGYLITMQGATYGVIPSFYEPFGMVNEFYLKGSVGIGRATGGILQQIVPYRQVNCFNRSVSRRADRWYSEHTPPTGFLFREPDDLPGALDDWYIINEAKYNPDGSPDRVEQRSSLPVFKAMTHELKLCLFEATDIYFNNRDLYHTLLINGVNYIRKNFSWNLTARAYHGFAS